MTELPAAVLSACILLVLWNVYYRIWVVMHVPPLDFRRVAKYIAVSWRQLSGDNKVVAALIVFLASVVFWFAMVVR